MARIAGINIPQNKVVNGETSINEINNEISGLIDGIKGWLWIFSQYKYAKNLNSFNIWLV